MGVFVCLCVWVYLYMYICNTALEIFGNILLNRITIIIIYYYIDSYRSYQVRITYRIINILSTLISISIFFFQFQLLHPVYKFALKIIYGIYARNIYILHIFNSCLSLFLSFVFLLPANRGRFCTVNGTLEPERKIFACCASYRQRQREIDRLKK